MSCRTCQFTFATQDPRSPFQFFSVILFNVTALNCNLRKHRKDAFKSLLSGLFNLQKYGFNNNTPLRIQYNLVRELWKMLLYSKTSLIQLSRTVNKALNSAIQFTSLLTISSAFNSLFKVLFTFPSQYFSAIGLFDIFSFRWNLSPIRAAISNNSTPWKESTLMLLRNFYGIHTHLD